MAVASFLEEVDVHLIAHYQLVAAIAQANAVGIGFIAVAQYSNRTCKQPTYKKCVPYYRPETATSTYLTLTALILTNVPTTSQQMWMTTAYGTPLSITD